MGCQSSLFSHTADTVAMFLPCWLRYSTGVLLLTLVSCTHSSSPPISESPDSPIATPAKSAPAKLDAVALNNQGVGKMQKQDYKGAIADFSTAIKLKPDLVEAYLSRGVAHSLTKNPKAAIADYTKAIKLKPTRADAYLNRADDLFVLGDKDKAIADLKQAKRLFTRQQNTQQAQNTESRLVALQAFRAQSQPSSPPPASPAPQPTPSVEATAPSSPTGYIEGTCGDLAAMGLSRFRPGDPNYTSRRDRDGDGIACE